MTLIIAINVVFIAGVVIGIVSLLSWGIVSDNHWQRRPRRAAPATASARRPRTQPVYARRWADVQS